MKHIVCYSGGHSSALVALEVSKRYGVENTILLNHNISSKVEHQDIKRFKKEIANYIGIDITQADHEDYEEYTPLKVVRELKAFKVGEGTALCTNRLKTAPFHQWLKENCSKDKSNYCIHYGFDAEEEERITNRKIIMRSMGYETQYPLADWDRRIQDTESIGIARPITYKIYKHANCVGCLKAGKQHWYAVYCLRPDIFQEAIETEKYIGYSILKNEYLIDCLPEFKEMQEMGICPSEKMDFQTFWAKVKRTWPGQFNMIPCDCAF